MGSSSAFDPYVNRRFSEIIRAGHLWRWTTTGMFRPHWKSTDGRDVIVFTPRRGFGEWTVGLRRVGQDGYCTTLPWKRFGEQEVFAYANRLRLGEDITPNGDPIR